MSLAATRRDGIYQWLEFVCATTGDASNETFLGKTLGDGAAGGIAGADDQYDFLVMGSGGHEMSPFAERSLTDER